MRFLSITACAALLASCATTAGTPPAVLGAAPFYQKHVDAMGIPILASSRVPDEALFAARDMMRGMLAHRPDLAEWLAANDYRVALIARDEALLDLPENAHWTKPARDDPRLTRCEAMDFLKIVAWGSTHVYANMVRTEKVDRGRTSPADERE